MIGSRILLCIGGMCCIAPAAHGRPQTVVLPPVNLAATETAEINLRSLAADYPGWGFGGDCQASATFYGADGSILGSPAAFIVGRSGQIFTAKLPYALTGAKALGTVVSAQIVLIPASYTYDGGAPPIPDCAVGFSLDTYDTATGAAHTLVAGQAAQGTTMAAIVGAVPVLPCLSPGDDCGQIYNHELTPTEVIVVPPVGLAATETAQIDITSAAAGYSGFSAGTCDASVTFYGPDGAAIGLPFNFTLGKTAEIYSAALPYIAVGSKASPTPISAQMALTAMPDSVFYPASAVLPCVAAFSLKTFDTATGVTHVYMAGQTTQDAAGVVAAGPASAPQRRRPPGK